MSSKFLDVLLPLVVLDEVPRVVEVPRSRSLGSHYCHRGCSPRRAGVVLVLGLAERSDVVLEGEVRVGASTVLADEGNGSAEEREDSL